MEENISKKRQAESYRWYRDTKMIGTLILLLSVTMQVFAWIHVPILTTIHAYTIGMIFGDFNPFFYFYAGYYGLMMIFEHKIELPTWVKTTKVSYWFIVLSTIFVFVSFSNYSGDITVWGTDAFGVFHVWFRDFTNNHGATSSWLIPGDTLGGIAGASMYSFIATIFSGIGSIVIAVGLLITSISILVTGTALGLYRDILNKDKIKHSAKLEKYSNTFEVESIATTTEMNIPTPDDKVDDAPTEDPFDDPFDDPFGGE